MKPSFRVKKIETAFEKDIIIGMIVSDKICRELSGIFNPEHFQTSYARIIAQWCVTYYQSYGNAPATNISMVYEREQMELEKGDAEIIEKILEDLSERFSGEEAFNEDYLLDKAFAYLKKRELWIRAAKVQSQLEKGNLAEAEEEFIAYRPVGRVTSGWVNPFETNHIIETAFRSENPFFMFPGALGRFLGPLKRGWFIAFMGPRKRGKTFNLVDFGIDLAMSGLRIAVFSLEMTEDDMKERVYLRISALNKSDSPIIIPVFDCALNQTGDCDLHLRRNRISLIEDEDSEIPEYDPDSKYKICTVCRNQRKSPYSPAIWYEQLSKKAWNVENLHKSVKGFEQQFGANLRMKCYPRFSANMRMLRADLDILEYTEGFIPDVIIVDYLDILAPEDARLSERGQLDQTWKTAAMVGGERNALMISASQTNRASEKKAIVEGEDASDDIRKRGHVDIMMTINQTVKEKRSGLMRLGLTDHRHKEADPEVNVLMTQHLGMGQVHLDSMLVRVRDKQYIYQGY